MKNRHKIPTLTERNALIMESFNKTVLLLEGEKAFLTEQQQLNEIDFAKMKDTIMSKLPGVKANAETVFNGVKEKVGEHIGVAKEELSKPENQAKVKDVLSKLGNILVKIKNAGAEILNDPKKLQGLISTLNVSTYASLIAGVCGLVFGSSFGITAIFTGGAVIGGLFFFKLALALFIIKTILSVVKGVSTVGETLGNIGSFMKSIIGIFTPSNGAPDAPVESYVRESLNESLNRLVVVHGY